MRLALLVLLLPSPALAARVAGERTVAVVPSAPRTVLPGGEGCRSSTDLTNTFATMRPAVSACLGTATAPLVIDVTDAGAVSVRIGDATIDACLAKVAAPSLGKGKCTLRTEWPRWADPRSLAPEVEPKDALTEDARIAAAKQVWDAAGLGERCVEHLQGKPGTFRIDVTPAEDGHVRTVAVTPQAVPNAAFEGCLLEGAWALRYPPMRPALPQTRTLHWE